MDSLKDARQDMEQQYDATVRADIEAFRVQIDNLLAGRITDDEFRAHRLRRGIYGQRQPGVQMIRTKIPGGIATAAQVERLGEIADEFAEGKAHLTTRQNVQYHFVALPQVPALLHKLADLRLTTREACYNTVRNVTASPTAGLNHDEPFDVTPYARRVAFAFLHKELTDNLPRKFKIAFSSSSRDEMLGSIHDAGLIPVLREVDGEQKRGFRLVIGGGLGPMPSEAHLLDEFIPEERLVNRIEAVVRLFNRHGNRKNRNKARLKFILRERGFEWVQETIEQEYQDILQNGGIPMPDAVPEGFGGFQAEPPPIGNGALLPVLSSEGDLGPEYDRWLETNVRDQRQAGYGIVTIRLDQGNLSGSQLKSVADIARTAGDGLVRFGIDQNLLLGNIPLAHLKRVYLALRAISLHDAGAYEIVDVVSCPGAYSCNLALTKSMNLGSALKETVKDYTDPEIRKLSIKISGCPNSCGQHWAADFGFFGNVRKIQGHEVPYYQMLLGGAQDEHGIVRFGLTVQSIPAKQAGVALQRVVEHYQQNREAGESFREYVLRNKIETFRALTLDLAKPTDLNDDIVKDWGDDTHFSLQLGRGECAA